MNNELLRTAVSLAMNSRLAAEDDDEIGDLQIAEYVVFLLALDTYIRYVEEMTDAEPADDVTMRGIRILRISDAMISEGLEKVLNENLPTDAHKKMLARAMAIRAINPENAGRRALMLRTILSRGGPSTQRAVFQTNRALREIREAIAASMMDDADAALDKFAAIQMQNTRLRNWMALAAKTAVQREIPKNDVEAGSREAVDQANVLLKQQVESAGATGSEDVEVAQTAQSEILSTVEQTATQAARKALETSGETDTPPTRAETVGIAVAAATAALSDPSKPQNVPDPLRKLDDEQRAAALTDGRVLVAASAGAGKSTTLVSRVEYLVKERRVMPSRILVTSFNAKAANELKQKIGSAVGGDALTQMSVGTMHSLFRRFIGEYGTPQEQSAMGVGKDKGGFIQGGGMVSRAVQRVWSDCFPEGTADEKEVPKLKDVLRHKSKWAGNNVTPADARAQARSQKEADSALWYEFYEGMKGAIPGWKPPCPRSSKSYESFMGRWRPRDQRLGDFDDMLIIFRDILKREPMVRKAVQNMYDFVMVDECQDLNQCQNDVVEMMTEHIREDSSDKSVWMVGDDRQSIYSFRGARPDIFIKRADSEDWKVRTIRTNYRCQPEIVEAANKLIAHNEDQIPMEAVPSPAKARGVASVRVLKPTDEAEGALEAIEEIKTNVDSGGDVADNAILCRTNKEIHSFETACIIRGIPYARKGASSFLGSPETKAFLSYVQLATGDDYTKMQAALGEVINKPNRFFVAPNVAVQAVEEACSAYARRNGQDVKSVNPMVALGDPYFTSILAEKLVRTRSGFKFDKAVEKLEDLQMSLQEMQANSEDAAYTTKDLFDAILGMSGINAVTDPRTGRASYVEQTFRESLQADLRDSSGDDDDSSDDDDEDETKGLGNISFLYKLAEPDPTDPADQLTTPTTPIGFKAKMERYAAKARDLRIDITKWDKEQEALPPEQRKAPPGTYLGTVHCSPADEPVLTTTGWVPIGEIDPEKHRLASYVTSCNQLFWGRKKGNYEGPDGYGFVKGFRFYKGQLLTLTTDRSKTRVTPDHKIRVKWAESFHNKYVVYLMRRGDWWRIGHCKSCPRPYKAGDLGSRIATEQADGGWILKVCQTKEEAILEETRLQGLFGIPGTTFEAAKNRSVTSAQLHVVHESVAHAVGPRAEALLAEFGLNKEHPLYVGGSDRECDKRESFTILARNCLSEYMVLPVVSEAFIHGTGPREIRTKPEWHSVTVSSEEFEGDVFSLEVYPHHFYVSGGAIVHNSVKGAQWRNVYVQMPKGKFPFEPRMKPGQPPPPPEEVKEELEGERRLGYVALTRAAQNLTILCPSVVGGKPGGVSPFVNEAGLHTGENVEVPGATPPLEGSPEMQAKTANDYEGVLPDEWESN